MHKKGEKRVKKGEDHSDPIYTNPIKNLPNLCFFHGHSENQFLRTMQRSGVTPANQTKERALHELFSGAFRNKSSKCEFRACFPKEKHQNITKKWVKFLNFSFCPFLWFGLPGRLLKRESLQESSFKTQVRGLSDASDLRYRKSSFLPFCQTLKMSEKH